MKNKKTIYFFIPLLLLLTISCTCGAPKLSNLMSENELKDIVGDVESELEIPAVTSSEEPAVDTENSEPVMENNTTGGDIEVVLTTHFKYDSWTTIVGLMRNNTNTAVSSVDMSVILYDVDGKIIATESVYPLLSMIPSGETIPFNASSDSWGDFASYEFVLDDYYETDQELVSDVSIVNEHIEYGDYSTTIIGEVQNNSDQTVTWVNVAAVAYDENGILLDTMNAYVMLDMIPAGDKAPFRMYFNNNWDNIGNYDLFLQASPTVDSIPDLTVVDYEVSEDDYSTTFSGTVKNNSGVDLSYAQIVASFYDASGQIVAAEWTYLEQESLPANGTGTFALTIWDKFEYSEVVFQAQ
jgi:hypothetical protein